MLGGKKRSDLLFLRPKKFSTSKCIFNTKVTKAAEFPPNWLTTYMDINKQCSEIINIYNRIWDIPVENYKNIISVKKNVKYFSFPKIVFLW